MRGDSFSSSMKTIDKQTLPYFSPLCSLVDETSQELTRAWNTDGPYQMQQRTRCRKRALAPTTDEPASTGETSSFTSNRSSDCCAAGKDGSGMEAGSLPRSTRTPLARAA